MSELCDHCQAFAYHINTGVANEYMLTMAGVQTIAKGIRERKTLEKARDSATQKYDKLLKTATRLSRAYGCAERHPS